MQQVSGRVHALSKGLLTRFEECGEAGGDGGPGEMLAVGEGALLVEAGAEFGIGQDADEGLVEFGGAAGGGEEYTGIGDGPENLFQERCESPHV